MLRAIIAVLLILWLLGFVLHIGGGVIHILAVIGVAVLIYDLVTGKRPEKSKSPSSNWGMTTSGNVEGEKTNLLSQRKLESISVRDK